MNKLIESLAEDACGTRKYVPPVWQFFDGELEKFVELIGEHPQTIAQSIREALNKTTWKPVSEPPELVKGPYGWPSSVPVLAIEGNEYRVMTFERVDEDCEPRWFTNCAERWDLTSTVHHWMKLPEFERKLV